MIIMRAAVAVLCADETQRGTDTGVLAFLRWCEWRGPCTLIDQRVLLCFESHQSPMQDMKKALHDTPECLRALREGKDAL